MNNPTHDDIAQLAHELWQESGATEGDALKHWLEAERRLKAGASKSGTTGAEAEPATHRTVSESKSEGAKQERAAQQRKEAREPIRPTHTGPKLAPPESGKPLWNQPHSS